MDLQKAIQPPTVSVVICTVGRKACLCDTIEAVRRQTWRPLELVLVIGPSRDGTHEYASTLSDVRLVHVDRLNLSHARNAGIRNSAGQLVAFIDDDCQPTPAWLEELVSLIQAEGPLCGGVGGMVINQAASDGELQFRHGAVSSLGATRDVRLEPAHQDDPSLADTGPWFNRLMGTNMLFRARALRAVGGFDETYAYQHDETDLCVSVIKAGFRIAHHAQALVRHFPATSHNRKNGYELNWHALLRTSAYFALKHSTLPATACVKAVARRHWVLLQTFKTWTRRREISVFAAARYTFAWLRGLAEGTRLGLAFRRKGAKPVALAECPHAFLPLATHAPASVRFPSCDTRDHRPLNIALVCAEFGSPNMGGIGMYTQHLAEALAARGHAVVVVRSGRMPSCSLPRGYRVVSATRFAPEGERHQISIHKCLLREGPFDVVEAPLWAGEAGAAGLAGQWPLVVRLETPFEYVRRISGLPLDQTAVDMIAAERLELSYAAGVISISRAIGRSVEEVYDLRLDEAWRLATVIPLGLPPADRVARQSVELPSGGGVRFLYVGRLEARKGVMELGQAFATVAARIPDATLWIAGADNSAHDGHQRRTGTSYVDTLHRLWGDKLSSRVRFFGQVSEPIKNELYAQCDVLVVPSRYESFGLILLEAMRFGKPVIATETGGIPEIVEQGKTGLLVPPESPAHLAHAMLTLASDPLLRQRLGKAGLARFSEHFTMERCAERTEQFYREVIDHFRPGNGAKQPQRGSQDGADDFGRPSAPSTEPIAGNAPGAASRRLSIHSAGAPAGNRVHTTAFAAERVGPRPAGLFRIEPPH